jgi:hypothetical protein
MKLFEYHNAFVTGGLKKEYQYDGPKEVRPGHVPQEAANYRLVIERGNLVYSLLGSLWERTLALLNHPCCGGFPWNYILPEKALDWFSTSLAYFDGKREPLTSVVITDKQCRILSPSLIEFDEELWWRRLNKEN